MPAINRKAQGIFISYRRTGTRADAGRLYDRLATHFGRDHVFMDIDDIEPGQDFQKVLQETLANCQVLLVLIGPGWLEFRDSEGSIRLQDKEDFVRIEVESALQRGLPVIPILINRALMPGRNDLPLGIEALADRQALEISDKRFHEDVDNLIQTLALILVSENKARTPPRLRTVAFAIAILLILGSLWFALSNGWLQKSKEENRADEISAGNLTGTKELNLRPQPTQVSQTELATMLLKRNFFDASLNPGGAGRNSRYERSIIEGDGVIIDNNTGLMWQLPGPGFQHPFTDAWLGIHKLNKDNFAGHADWRLPTLEEAMSILIPVKQADTHMPLLFSPKNAPVFWTADEDPYNRPWVVYAYAGVAENQSPDFNAWTRAVRSMQ